MQDTHYFFVVLFFCVFKVWINVCNNWVFVTWLGLVQSELVVGLEQASTLSTSGLFLRGRGRAMPAYKLSTVKDVNVNGSGGWKNFLIDV